MNTYDNYCTYQEYMRRLHWEQNAKKRETHLYIDSRLAWIREIRRTK